MLSTRRPASRTTANASDEQVVERLAVGDALAELVGLAAELFVGEGLDLRFERADLGDQRPEPLDLTLVLRADDLGEELTDHSLPGVMPVAPGVHRKKGLTCTRNINRL